VVILAKIDGGYFIISRKIIESAIWDKPPLYMKVWIYLLSRAQYKPYKQLDRGQLITSIPEIMEGCSWHQGSAKYTPTKDQVYQVLEWMRKPLEGNNVEDTKATMITTTRATRCLLVTIDNYNFYQEPNNYESNDESNGINDTKATPSDFKSDCINKERNKNVKNDKNNIFTSDSIECRLSEFLFKHIRENDPKMKEPNFQKWAKDINSIIRLDKREPEEIKKVIQWCQESNFWKSNILSPGKLRKQYSTLLIQMKNQESTAKKEAAAKQKEQPRKLLGWDD